MDLANVTVNLIREYMKYSGLSDIEVFRLFSRKNVFEVICESFEYGKSEKEIFEIIRKKVNS